MHRTSVVASRKRSRRLIHTDLETPSKRHLNIWKDISEKEVIRDICNGSDIIAFC